MYFLAPVNCEWNIWTEWSNCSSSCGGGTQVKTRQILIPAANGGTNCTGTNEIIQNCNINVTCNDTKGILFDLKYFFIVWIDLKATLYHINNG